MYEQMPCQQTKSTPRLRFAGSEKPKGGSFCHLLVWITNEREGSAAVSFLFHFPQYLVEMGMANILALDQIENVFGDILAAVTNAFQ